MVSNLSNTTAKQRGMATFIDFDRKTCRPRRRREYGPCITGLRSTWPERSVSTFGSRHSETHETEPWSRRFGSRRISEFESTFWIVGSSMLHSRMNGSGRSALEVELFFVSASPHTTRTRQTGRLDFHQTVPWSRLLGSRRMLVLHFIACPGLFDFELG